MPRYTLKNLIIIIFILSLASICGAVEVIKKDLGVRNPSFGSMGQSIELLKLIKSTPHQFQYEISYKTEVDTVLFGCDLGHDTVTRIHKQKNGTGTAEKWQGDAMFRLQSAAKGGTLNDTKSGKSAGTIVNFE